MKNRLLTLLKNFFSLKTFPFFEFVILFYNSTKRINLKPIFSIVFLHRCYYNMLRCFHNIFIRSNFFFSFFYMFKFGFILEIFLFLFTWTIFIFLFVLLFVTIEVMHEEFVEKIKPGYVLSFVILAENFWNALEAMKAFCRSLRSRFKIK